MRDEENIKLLNLCIDESGTASIGITRNRFFLLTAVVISPDQQELSSLLFTKWRKKHLVNPSKSFHAADFFEDFEDDYRKPELKILRHFKAAVNELVTILSIVDFKAKVYFVDLPGLRKKIGVRNVPEFKDEKTLDGPQKMDYRRSRKQFEEYLKIHHKGNKNTPYTLPLLETFKYHLHFLEEEEKQDIFKRKHKGFISFESLSGADVKPVGTFHKYKDKIGSEYGERIIGINFPTKNSLDGGIELADLISYISCQTLRSKRRLYGEMLGITDKRKQEIKKLRKFMRINCKTEFEDVTGNSLP